jgi:hypothetical protein
LQNNGPCDMQQCESGNNACSSVQLYSARLYGELMREKVVQSPQTRFWGQEFMCDKDDCFRAVWDVVARRCMQQSFVVARLPMLRE